VLRQVNKSIGGGLRDRLKVTLQSDKTELFVVDDLDQVIERLRADISQ
jgi:hypothetical protein